MKMSISILLNRRFLLALSVLILVSIAGSTFYNFKLKKNLRALESPIEQPNEETLWNDETSGIRVVVTGDEDIGSEQVTKIELSHELTIAEQPEVPATSFHRAGPILSDSDGNIYIIERLDGVIKKFDKNGNFLLQFGRKGLGPGEISGNLGIKAIIEKDTILTVFDAGSLRITQFNNIGIFLKTFPLQLRDIDLPTGPIGGFLASADGSYYLSYLDPHSEKVIHKFSSTGEHLTSFGDPVAIKNELGGALAFMAKMNLSPGCLLMADDHLVFAPHTPYEIRRYSLDGHQLQEKIIRKNSFMESRIYEMKSDNSVTVSVPPRISAIGSWGDLLVCCVSVSPNREKNIGAIIDLFNSKGKLQASFKVKKKIFFSHISENGKLYGKHTGDDDGESIVRYALHVAE